MSTISRMFKQFLLIEVLACTGFLMGGLLLTIAEAGYHRESFYSYRISMLDHSPAWIVLLFILVAIGGAAIFRWALITGGIGSRGSNLWRDYSAFIPLPNLKIIGINMIAVPSLLLCFLAIRAINL